MRLWANFLPILLLILLVASVKLFKLFKLAKLYEERIFESSNMNIIVIDGDTFRVCYSNKCKVVRIYGIDAPEYKKPQKNYVIKNLERMLGGKVNVSCLDYYGFKAFDFLDKLFKRKCRIKLSQLEKISMEENWILYSCIVKMRL